MRRTARRLATLAALVALAPLAGCEWWLTFQSGGSSLAEFLLQSGGYHIENGVIVPNTPPVPAPSAGAPPQATAPGGGAGAGGSGGGGAGSASPAPAQPAQPSPDAAKAAPAAPLIPVSMTIAGRMWRVTEARSSVVQTAPAPAGRGGTQPGSSAAPPTDAISLELLIEHSGLAGSARMLVPIAQWPTDPSGAPVALAWQAPGGAPAPAVARSEPGASDAFLIPSLTPLTLPLTWPLGLTGVEIAGQRYDLEITAASIAASSRSPALTVAGAVDGVARRAGDANAARQLVRVRFAPDAITRPVAAR